MRRGAEAARRAHNPEVVGSNPTAATISLLDTVPMALGLQSMHFLFLASRWRAAFPWKDAVMPTIQTSCFWNSMSMSDMRPSS